MSWRETCPMNERVRFITALLQHEWTMTELCEHFGISRRTGYKWWHRYEKAGVEGLRDRSRACRSHPNATRMLIQEKLVALRHRRGWGPRKLLHYLSAREPDVAWPAPSTVGAILKRRGLVKRRRRSRRTAPYSQPFTHCDQPNAVWSADFKGEFRTGDGRLCYPLTIADSFSRYLLCCRGLSRPSGILAKPYFEAVFRQYGLPVAIRTDNGAPFASTALAGLSSLAVWWIKLGIRPERIAVGHPEQNGRHERMHRTLKQEAIQPPKSTLRAQQRAFNRFREEYNQERPHESLGGKPPACYYRHSLQPYPRRLPQLEYPAGWLIRKVRHNGEIRWQGQRLYLSEVLAGEPVGLKPTDDLNWHIYFGPVPLGILTETATQVLPMCPV